MCDYCNMWLLLHVITVICDYCNVWLLEYVIIVISDYFITVKYDITVLL